MRKFFETPDGKLLEADSKLNLSKTNMKEYDIKTGDDGQPYVPQITKIDRGYFVKVKVPDETEHSCDKDNDSYGEKCDECKAADEHAKECDGCNECEEFCEDKIVFIELDIDGILRLKRYIGVNEVPEINFYIPHGKIITAYSYSQKGGLWMSTLKEEDEKK